MKQAILLSLAAIALCETPQQNNLVSPAAELNKELPKWLSVSGEYRARFEGFSGGGFQADSNDYYLLNRIRIGLKVQPADWLKFVFQAQDSRIFWNGPTPDAPPYANPMDLRVGYLELGDSEGGPASLRAGRQELNFGEQRLVGSSNWTNTARTFDAVRATFRHHGYRLDVFAASVVSLKADEFDRPEAGSNLHGIYGGIEKLVPKAVIEPYVFWRLAPRHPAETGGTGNLDSKTIGIRWAGKLPMNFDYGAEMALQRGSLAGDRVGAWAGHWVIGYTIAAAWTPRVFAEYNYASGDNNPSDGTRGTFDHLYPTSHDKYGLADQVGWRNIRDLRCGIEMQPRRKLTVKAAYHNWWLASARDALYNTAGSVVARVPDGSAGTHVGQELDLQAAYPITEQIQIAGGVGRIFPGEFLKKATPGRPYTFPFLMLSYGF